MTRPVETPERRVTVEEYHRMAEAGILPPDERVELLLGVVRRMSPKNWAHVVAANRIFDLFRRHLEGRARVYKEDPLRQVGLDSEREPDVMVCAHPDLNAFGTESMKPLLVIEVAESSLARDLGEKLAIYAKAAIPEYWVVNLVDRVLDVFRDPAEGRYRQRASLFTSARVSPQAWPELELEVSALFPDP
jgi:Uma2 family endonuclease